MEVAHSEVNIEYQFEKPVNFDFAGQGLWLSYWRMESLSKSELGDSQTQTPLSSHAHTTWLEVESAR